MARALKNLANLFRDTRSRVIILFAGFLILIGILVGIFALRERTVGVPASATIPGTPGIQSIPGGMDPTAQYSKLVEQSNVEKAQEAEKTKKSVLPTIVRFQKFGEGKQIEGTGEGAIGFASLAQKERLGGGIEKDVWLAQLKESNCSAETVQNVQNQGAQLRDIVTVCSCAQLKIIGLGAEVLKEVCDCPQLKAAGFTSVDLKNAGFNVSQLKNCGYDDCDLKVAGFSKSLPAGVSENDIKKADCTPEGLRRLRASGVSASVIRQTNNCSASALKAAGFTADDLKTAGFSALQLQQAGFSAGDLLAAGYSLKDLKESGFDAVRLKRAGLNASQLVAAGFNAQQLTFAKFTPSELEAAGIAAVIETPVVAVEKPISREEELKDIMARQAAQIAEQQHQQQIQQKAALMRARLGETLAAWEPVTQVYIAGNPLVEKDRKRNGRQYSGTVITEEARARLAPGPDGVFIKTGDILFAVLDTSVNSDEPGPVLATIVGGRLKGAKLIGGFTLPANGQKVILSFNRLSVPELPQTISINAIAVDPDTARTALASRTDNHYLLRYGSLLASSFMEGFGNAVMSGGTTVTFSPPMGFTVERAQRSTRQNALSALGKVGQRLGNAVAPLFNRPPTVELYSGVGMGILFTNDVSVNKAVVPGAEVGVVGTEVIGGTEVEVIGGKRVLEISPAG